MKHLVYALIDPESKLIRYIGKSSSGLARPKQHMRPYYYDKAFRVSRWVKSLVNRNLSPTIHVLELVSDRDRLIPAEVWWIAYGRCLGWPLTNLTDGGEGNYGWNPSEETRTRMSIANKKRPPWSAESRHKASLASAKRTLEGIQISIEAMRTPEANAKKSLVSKGRPKSPSHKAKLAINLAKARAAQKLKRLGR